MKFVVALAAMALAALIGWWASRSLADRPRREPGAEANARLTGYVAVVLLIPLAAAIVTGVRPGLLAHALIGFLLVPPTALKLSSVAYRFARYYAGDPAYRSAGAPDIAMRLLGPPLVLLTLALFATGIELWLFGSRFGDEWRTWHVGSFLLWSVAMTAHVVAYLRRAPDLAIADSRDRLRGTLERRSLVAGSVLLGVALAIAMLPYPSPFTPPPGGG